MVVLWNKKYISISISGRSNILIDIRRVAETQMVNIRRVAETQMVNILRVAETQMVNIRRVAETQMVNIRRVAETQMVSVRKRNIQGRYNSVRHLQRRYLNRIYFWNKIYNNNHFLQCI